MVSDSARTTPVTAGRLRCDLIVDNAIILTVDGNDRVIANGAMAIDGGRILAVDRADLVNNRYEPMERIGAEGGVIHPGYIDAHIHVSQYAARSVLPRMEGTEFTMGHWKAEISPEDEHASALLAAMDYLRCGYTGFVDPGTIFEPDAVASVAEEAGIRIWLTDPYVADAISSLSDSSSGLYGGRFLARWPQSLDDALSRLGSQLWRNKNPDTRVHAFIGLYGDGTDSPDLYRAALDLARRERVHFQEHLFYSSLEAAEREATLGRPLLEAWAEDDRLGPDVSFIHMNFVRESDVALLASAGVRIVACPYGQLQMLGRGTAQIRTTQLHKAGVPVGLATDIPRAIDFDGLGSLAFVTAAALGEPLTAQEILRMRTIGAAATVGADQEVGSLEAGKRADFVIRSALGSSNFGFDSPHETAVLGGRDSVSKVFVAGQAVAADGVVLGLDEHAVVWGAHESARRIANRIGL